MRGKVSVVEIESIEGGEITLENPFKNHEFESSKAYDLSDNVIKLNLQKGEKVQLKILR